MLVSSADQTLTADGTIRKITWDTETYDDGAFHAGSSGDVAIPSGYGGTGSRFRLEAHIDVTTANNVLDLFLLTSTNSRIVSARVIAGVAEGGYDMSLYVDAPADATTYSVGYSKASTNATMNHIYDVAGGSWFSIHKVK